MAETNKKFTPEQIRAFEDKYNLGVNNREAIVELFMRQQEQIDEIAKNLHVEKTY